MAVTSGDLDPTVCYLPAVTREPGMRNFGSYIPLFPSWGVGTVSTRGQHLGQIPEINMSTCGQHLGGRSPTSNIHI
jgi:hypothetical protein